MLDNLSVSDAANAFAGLLGSPAAVDPAAVDPAAVDPAAVDPAPVDPAPVDPAPVDPAAVDPAAVDPAAVDPAAVDPAAVDPAAEAPKYKVKIDGVETEVPLDELINGYQRTADYTRKTMEVAAQRKEAEAQAAQAAQERAKYAQSLAEQHTLLAAALNEQQNIDWGNLIENDPVEYLKQQHLFQQRQAAYQSVLQEQQTLQQQNAAEQQKQYDAFLKAQQDSLLAKLPEWKDDVKAKTEKKALREYLKDSIGFEDNIIDQVADHRMVLLARKAMFYDQMLSKANAAAKKVGALPPKVEKPGVQETPSLDRRTSAYQKLSKSGSVNDAAAVFHSFL